MTHLSTRFPADDFTLSIRDRPAKRMQCNGTDLRHVQSRRDFRSGAFVTEDSGTFVAIDLPTGATTLTITR
jgi:hypothetical protein